MSGTIHSTEDARAFAKCRLPRLVFDFIEGAAGRELGAQRNESRLADILLQARAMVPAGERSLDVELLGNRYQLPFGFAPMGMCNLVCPHADQYMAETASQRGLPHCLSSAGSTSLEQVHGWADGNAWFQLYFRQSEQATMAVVDRVRDAGYKTLVLTVDVPQVSRRLRDLRNGFNVPFSLTVRSFIDFASHPRWSLATLLAGIPSPQNFSSAVDTGRFDRKADRAGADWDFLARLRKRWHGKLIVKGITSASDAKRIVESGADAIYVSNHGARQLDATAAAIDLLMPIRRAVGPSCPLIFDSGIRNGEDVVKAYACGASFVMLGRPVLYALGANGKNGLRSLLDGLHEDISVAMAQLGVERLSALGPQHLHT